VSACLLGGLLQVARSAAQTVVQTSVTAWSVSKTSLLYGQAQTYNVDLTVPTGSGLPPGTVNFNNGSATLATAALSTNGVATLGTLVPAPSPAAC
jgi:hypothetical protein